MRHYYRFWARRRLALFQILLIIWDLISVRLCRTILLIFSHSCVIRVVVYLPRSQSLPSNGSCHGIRERNLSGIWSSCRTLKTKYLPLNFLVLWWRVASSGMLRRVALVRTDVSEDLSASFIRVTRIGELGTTLTVTSNRHTSEDKYIRRNMWCGVMWYRESE
jgi:hypothetical protein